MRRHGPVIAHCTNSVDFPDTLITRTNTTTSVSVFYLVYQNTETDGNATSKTLTDGQLQDFTLIKLKRQLLTVNS